jgi:hypothetical protein
MAKHRYVIVLAGSTSEGHTYARRAGVARFTYRVPSNAASIRKLQAADVHVLPSFAGRRDRHSILAELRYGRDITMIDVEMPEPAVVDQGDGFGEQLTIDDYLPRKKDFGLDVPATVALVRKDNPELADALKAVSSAEALAKVREVLSDPTLTWASYAENDGFNVTREQFEEISLSLGLVKDPEDENRFVRPAPEPARAPRRTRCPVCSELVLGLAGHTAEKHSPTIVDPATDRSRPRVAAEADFL